MSTISVIQNITEALGIKYDEAAELYTEALWDDSNYSFLRGLQWLQERGFTVTRHPSELGAHFQRECTADNCNSGRCCL